jgi:hypothetical protein
MERLSLSRFWLVKAIFSSLSVTIFVLSVALLASCSGGNDEGSKEFNKEETSTSEFEDRNKEDTSSSEEVALVSGSENRDERGSQDSNSKVKGSKPKYPDPPPQSNSLPATFNPEPGHGWYHPDVDGDGVGSGDYVEYELDKQPPGWVDYRTVHWDNCPETCNPNQEDSDNDGWGDFCDPEPFTPYSPNQAR